MIEELNISQQEDIGIALRQMEKKINEIVKYTNRQEIVQISTPMVDPGNRKCNNCFSFKTCPSSSRNVACVIWAGLVKRI